MSFKRTIKRFAHTCGFTYTSYSSAGELISCGTSDGDVRIWKDISDDDPSSFCVGESAVCCAEYMSPKKVDTLLCSTDNSVQSYLYPQGDRAGVLLRFTAPVSSIKISKKWIAAGSEDFTIKAQKREVTDEYLELKGHEGPILHIDLHPEKDQLASSSGDGTLRVWSLQKDPKVIKTFDGFEKINEFAAAQEFSTPTFNPSGSFLAFPKGNYIHVAETSDWEIKFKLENQEVTGKYSVCSFSFCGSMMAAGSTVGEISAWRIETKMPLKGPCQGEDPHGIVSIAWNPKDKKEFAFCDSDGQLSTAETYSKKKSEFVADEAMEDGVEDGPEENIDDLYGGMDFQDDPEDEDNENCVSLEKLKNQTLKMTDLSDDEDGKSVKSMTSMSASIRMPLAKPFLRQPVFQPGSTPVNLEHRFMMFNHVGQVMCHSNDEENSIIAEFHDVTVHPSIHILNNLNHELASLSTTCLALATKDTPCRLVCIAFVSAGSKEWSTAMPECEVIEAIAAGENFVAAATDSGFIRFFSIMGTQREVIAVPGPVVALAAFENKLVVAYHTSDTSNKFSIMIFTLVGPSMICKTHEMPMAPGTKLQWLGFSDVGSVVVYDSSGRVQSYNPKRNIWYPICDMMNHIVGASDNFFIISVSESSQMIRATLCRGTNYPLTTPRPIVREINYQIPLCAMETERGKLEDVLLRSLNFNVDSAEKIICETGLKLFSSAMNSELESKAFELIELIGNTRLIELASKYASQKGRIHMSNKIQKLLIDFEEKEKERSFAMNETERDTEIFSESYDIQTPKAAEKRAQETSTPIPMIAPKPMLALKKLNPFKKTGGNRSSSTTPVLSHLTKKSMSHNDSDDENTPTNNVSTKSTNRSVSLDTPRPGNFSQWYIANQSDLKSDNPEASDGELMKIAREIYKELTKKNKSIDESDNVNSSNLNKRKLNLTEENGGGIAKLAKYGFTKD